MQLAKRKVGFFLLLVIFMSSHGNATCIDPLLPFSESTKLFLEVTRANEHFFNIAVSQEGLHLNRTNIASFERYCREHGPDSVELIARDVNGRILGRSLRKHQVDPEMELNSFECDGIEMVVHERPYMNDGKPKVFVTIKKDAQVEATVASIDEDEFGNDGFVARGMSHEIVADARIESVSQASLKFWSANLDDSKQAVVWMTYVASRLSDGNPSADFCKRQLAFTPVSYNSQNDIPFLPTYNDPEYKLNPLSLICGFAFSLVSLLLLPITAGLSVCKKKS